MKDRTIYAIVAFSIAFAILVLDAWILFYYSWDVSLVNKDAFVFMVVANASAAGGLCSAIIIAFINLYEMGLSSLFSKLGKFAIFMWMIAISAAVVYLLKPHFWS